VYEVHVDSVLMNGSPTMEYFFQSKGQKQEDPLSPFLKIVKVLDLDKTG